MNNDAIEPAPPSDAPEGASAQDSRPSVIDESGFISMPPGMADLDSATYRLEQRRPEPAVAKSAPVFVPTAVPGLPLVSPPVEPELEAEPQAATAPVPESPLAPMSPVDEATRVAGAPPVDDATVVAPSRKVSWMLTIPGADAHRLQQGVTLLGRGPAASAEWPDARLLPLLDPRKSVSKTHAALEVAANGVLRVHDLNSTNGVWISYPNGDEVDVAPGIPQVVETGGTVHLGEFEVLASRG